MFVALTSTSNHSCVSICMAVITMPCNSRHMVHHKVTLHGLSDLLHRYSQLKALCINVSLLADDVKAFRSAGVVPNTSIRGLDLGYSMAEYDVLGVDVEEFSLACVHI
jgi:hypothetical protein